jgi:hypothetical protein
MPGDLCFASQMELGIGLQSLGWGLVISVISLLASLGVAVAVLVRLPSTYYQEEPRTFRSFGFSRLLRNALGLILIVAGAILALPGGPGQGLLTILVGFMLLVFPGKRRLELKLAKRPGVLGVINRLRSCFGSPPLLDGGLTKEQRP